MPALSFSGSAPFLSESDKLVKKVRQSQDLGWFRFGEIKKWNEIADFETISNVIEVLLHSSGLGLKS